jgi:tryptophan 2,3-dioxygenase
MNDGGVYYSDYLQLDKVLDAQFPESTKQGSTAHDEMLFIIVHQAYELWFKQVLYEVESVVSIFQAGHINDNGPDLPTAVHRLRRVGTILELLVKQVDVLDTMTPLDFLDFRDLLRPASGFQSIQFKTLEARLGLRMEQRHGQQYYTSQLRPKDKARIEMLEHSPSLFDLLGAWLERTPLFSDSHWPKGFESFWSALEKTYTASLLQGEVGNASRWQVLFHSGEGRRLTPRAARSALLMMLYRDEPLLQMPFALLQVLLNIDDALGQWRSRHMNMVRRMIGLRMGTGGSTGSGYLKGAMESHYVFQEIADLSSFLFQRNKLPELPQALARTLRFQQ